MLRILLTASLLKSGINACASLQGRLREKPQEGADIPLGRQTEQRQQVPHLDRTDLICIDVAVKRISPAVRSHKRRMSRSN
jgi:hypothetical protein